MPPDTQFLKPGENCWKVLAADRAALLLDGSNYFSAVRNSILKARKSILIIGWDIHSRTRLIEEKDREEGDEAPVILGELLAYVAKERSKLKIHQLLWDFSLLYSLERETFPLARLSWSMPKNVVLKVDSNLPAGASHHQKIVVIDGHVAYCGGFDLTICRWDRPTHPKTEPARVDPQGEPYTPYHDVQMVVSGEIAQGLGELARDRWHRATGETLEAAEVENDPWPTGVAPDFQDIDIALARTMPAMNGSDAIREVEALYTGAIGKAEKLIYIENQYFTSRVITDALSRKHQERPNLESLIISPQSCTGWLEEEFMGNGRREAISRLREAGVLENIVFACPTTGGDNPEMIMVHAKVMIIDNRIFTIGSANLNNRSMGFDSECLLAIEGKDERVRTAIAKVRNRLVGHFLALSPDAAEKEIFEKERSLRDVVREAEEGDGKLRKLPDVTEAPDPAVAFLRPAADPEKPVSADLLLSSLGREKAKEKTGSSQDSGTPDDKLGTSGPGGSLQNEKKDKRQQRMLILAALVTAVVIGLSLIWKFDMAPLSLDPETLSRFLAPFDGPAGALFILGVYLVGGFLVFPITVLIIATGFAYGPVMGLIYATLGSVVSALILFILGCKLGNERVTRLLGRRIDGLLDHAKDNGVIAITALRLLPVAPFSFINLAAGSAGFHVKDFLLGTVFGMAPGLVLLTISGRNLRLMMENPGFEEILLVVGFFSLWLAASWGLQKLVEKRRRDKDNDSDAAPLATS